MLQISLQPQNVVDLGLVCDDDDEEFRPLTSLHTTYNKQS